MTTFNAADIPPEITTVEQLNVWTSNVLAYLYPDLAVLESAGQAVRVASSGPFQITATDPSQWRNVSRVSVGLDAKWLGDGNQIWSYALPMGAVAIPPNFKA